MTARPSLAQPVEELELARRCAGRDPAAIRQLVTANNQPMFRAAWSILKDRDEAQDAVQSAYLNAFAHIGEFAGRSALSTWLIRIAINEALGRRRARQRRDSRLAAEGIAVMDHYRDVLMRGSGSEAPDAQVAREELRALIEKAVGELPEALRSVFVLRDVEGLGVEETADALGILAATVKTRLFRARRRLQAALAPEVRSALAGAFPFAGADCEAMTARILAALA